MKKRIIVLGCTGSIGKSTLELVREFPDLLAVSGYLCSRRPGAGRGICPAQRLRLGGSAGTEQLRRLQGLVYPTVSPSGLYR